METIVCKHEVRLMHKETETRCELALSLVRSLLADINEETVHIFQSTKRDMPEPDFYQKVGGLDAYRNIQSKLRQWETMLCREAGLPLPGFEEEIAECC